MFDCLAYKLESKEARKAAEKGKIEWQMWANALGVLAGFCMVLGGAVGISSDFNRQWAAVYSTGAGCVVFAIEWPRSKRVRGRTLPRAYQDVFSTAVSKVGLLHNLFVRFGLYLVMAIPCFFELPSILGGAVLVISSFVYLLAAFKNETWKHLAKPKARPKGGATIIAAPKQAPPRLPPTAAADRTSSVSSDTPSYQRKQIPAADSKTEENKSFEAPVRPPPQAPGRQPPPRPTPKSKPLPPRTSSTAPVWVQTVDGETKETYYYNSVTKETQWQRPSGTIELESDA